MGILYVLRRSPFYELYYRALSRGVLNESHDTKEEVLATVARQGPTSQSWGKADVRAGFSHPKRPI